MAMNNEKMATGKFSMKPGSKNIDSPSTFRKDSPLAQLGMAPTGMGASPAMSTGPKLEKCHGADAACQKRNREARKKHAQSKPAKYRPSEVGGTDAKNSGGKSYSPKKGSPIVSKGRQHGAQASNRRSGTERRIDSGKVKTDRNKYAAYKKAGGKLSSSQAARIGYKAPKKKS